MRLKGLIVNFLIIISEYTYILVLLVFSIFILAFDTVYMRLLTIFE